MNSSFHEIKRQENNKRHLKMQFCVTQILMNLHTRSFDCLCCTEKKIGQQNSQPQYGLYYWSKLLEKEGKNFLGIPNHKEFRLKEFALNLD